MSEESDNLDKAAKDQKELNEILGWHSAEYLVRVIKCHEDLLAACEDSEMLIKGFCEYLANRTGLPPNGDKVCLVVKALQAAIVAATP